MIILLSYILVFFAVDILSFITLSRGRILKAENAVRILKIIHILLSLLSWVLLIIIISRREGFTENRNISLMMFFGFTAVIIWLPRIVIILFSNAGYLLRKRFINTGLFLNYTGIFLSMVILITVSFGTLFGRFNFKYEEVNIYYRDLPAGLEGFRIVQLSDMHLNSFHNKKSKLEEVMDEITGLKPDILVNTGDFVTISWNEMPPFTSVLKKPDSKYGNYAIPGNHDAGTYHPYYTEEDRELNVKKIDSLIFESGYLQLKDSSVILNINGSLLKIAGVITRGTIPDIIFGDLEKALGDREADFTILLTHDPNHWYNELRDSDAVNLTLSGHTHGGQFGIRTGKFRWSPASLLYPAWSGLYGDGSNYLYVNRGLGTISLPTRIGMPPEITVINLNSKN